MEEREEKKGGEERKERNFETLEIPKRYEHTDSAAVAV